MDGTQGFVGGAGRAAIAGGVLGLGSLVTVLAGEITAGKDFMGTPAAQLAGWASFVASALLVVGLMGVGARFSRVLGGAGRGALLVLGFATAITVGAASTLALVVPTLVDHAPELVNDPPAAVPPTFIFSGLAMGICAIVLAVDLRRSGAVRGGATTFLTVAAVLAMVPLPSRFCLLSLALGVLLLAAPSAATVEASPTDRALSAR